MTTIKQAIKMLQELGDQYGEDTEIVMMSDAEGNKWSKMCKDYGTAWIDYYSYDEQLICVEDMEEKIGEGAEINDFEFVITLWRD